MYGYWAKREEDKNSIVSHVEGLAKIAGIIGLGIASRPYWSKLVGKGATFAAEQMGGRMTGSTSLAVIKDLMAENWRVPFVEFSHEMRTAAASNITARKRAEVFFSGLEEHTTEAISSATRKELLPHIGIFTKIGDLEDTDVDKFVLNTRAVDKLKSIMEDRGIKFTPIFQKNYHRVIEEIVGDTARVKPSQDEVRAYFNDPGTHSELKRAFDSLWTKMQKTVAARDKFLGGQGWLGKDWEHVTGAHLLADKDKPGGEIHNAVNNYLNKIGVSSNDSVTDIIQKMEDMWGGENEGVFLEKTNKSRISDSEKRFLHEKLAQTNTGLIYNTRTKQVVSLARVNRESAEHLDNLMDELQIPLVPFKFNIPLRMFKFMKPSTAKIRNLGSLGAEPELRRELQALGHNTSTINAMRGMTVDDKLLTFNMDTGELKFHDQSFKRVVSYERRRNHNIDKLLNVRDLKPDELRKYIGNFGTAEDSFSKTQSKVYTIIPKISEVQYNATRGGFEVKPKSESSLVEKLLVRTLYHQKELARVEDIHPTQLASWLKTQKPADLLKMDLHLLKRSYRHVIGEAAHDKFNLAPLLAHLGDEVRSGRMNLDRDGPFKKWAEALLDSAGDPRKLRGIIDRIEDEDVKLHGEISPGLFRALATMTKNPESMFEVSQGESGLLNNQVSDFLGQKGVGTGLEKVQEAILSQTLRENAVSQLAEELAKGGTGSQSIIDVFEKLRGGLQLADPFSVLNGREKAAIITRLKTVGVVDSAGMLDTTSMANMVDRMYDKSGRPIREQIGKFAEATMDFEQRAEILRKTSNLTEQAKMIGDMAEAVASMDVLNNPRGQLAQLHILDELTKVADVEGILKQRFTITRPFIPRNHPLSPLNANNYLSMTTNMPDLVSLVDEPSKAFGIIKQQAKRGFGVMDFMGALSDPEHSLGSFSAAIQILLTMPQTMANDVGIGLRGQDRLTALRTTVGFYGKRILPLVVGYEAYKNYNANMHQLGFPGIDDMAANIVGNVNLTVAGAKDMLGITGMNQWMVNTLPGLDQYFHPRSRQEYEDYLKYGNEEVRNSRGWMIGTRTPLMGENIKYIRPNAYRRWKSHWTEADNVDISNPKYSFLPNLMHPFAPINLMLDPNWWEEKHRSDRPYIPGGVGTQSPNQWAREENYTTINSMGGYGALGIGEVGGGYPTSMTGGGYDVMYDRRSDSLVTGRQGTGGIGIGTAINAKSAMGSYYGSSRSYGLRPGGKPIRLGLHKGIPESEVQTWSVPGLITHLAQAVRTEAGLYGAILQRLPGFPIDDLGFTQQDPRKAHSFGRMAWMGEWGEMPGPIGEAKEFFRRFIQPDSESYDAFNPLSNNMPSWLPDKFKTGDPYMRTPGIGELQLPGDAWERTHPWVSPLKVRGSNIGLSEKELIQKWLNPLEEIEGQSAQDIVEFGSAAHLQMQRQLRELGILVGAEVSIYNKEHNLSGTIDAIVRTADGNEILDFKTQGAKSWGASPEKYKDQLTTYMATTGIHKSALVFINRDDPQQVRVENVDFDPERWNTILGRVERARATMHGLIDKGLVSPFETYDLVSRIEILAKVSPGSPEFRDHVKHALESGLGGFEKQRVEQAVREANRQSQDFNLYPNRYGVELATATAKVEDIGSHGEIITSKGVLKLAGVDFDPQAFSFEDPESLLAKHGIHVGKRIKFQAMAGALNPEVMADRETPAIVGDANKDLVGTGYARWDDEETSRDPVASQARFGNLAGAGLWERFVHTDNLLTNKFMRVRTPLEQFERGEVFGTDKSKWNDPINSFVIPTINSFIHKPPLTAALQMGIVASMFARTNAPFSKIPFLRSKLAIGGAVFGAAISTARSVYETLSGDEWTPNRYRRQGEFDEYWDILKYLKYTSIAESAKDLAKKKENVDLDKLQQEERQTVGLGPYAILAIDAERKAKRTMFGYDVATGSLQDAISTLPTRQQQIAQSIIESGSLQERQKFYDLLPDSQRRVLGKFLGANREDLPGKQNLNKYFQSHFLPNVDWGGWGNEVDLEDLETRSAGVEGVKVDQPNRAKISKARSVTRKIPVPRMDNPTYGNIRSQIHNLLATGGYSNINVRFKMLPSDSQVVNVNMNLFDDQTDELINEMRKQL